METKTHFSNANWKTIAQFFHQASHKQCLLFASLLTFWSLQVGAQSYSEVDIAGFAPIVVSPDVYLNAGESAEYLIYIGSPTKPVLNAVGFKLNLELSADARQETTIDAKLDGWLGFENKLNKSQIPNLPAHYNLEYNKTAPNSGFGQVLKLKLVATSNNVHASRLIKSVGGIMIIDNLDVRFGNLYAAEKVEIKAFPNPSQGNVQLSGNLDNVTSLQILTLNGQRLRQFERTQNIDISDFETGCYLLEIRSKNGQSSFQKIIKN